MAYKRKVSTPVIQDELDIQDTNAETNNTTNNTVNIVTEKKEKKVFTDSDYILCHSVWYGGLNVTCRSGNSYEFKDYGKQCDINYRDLVDLVRKGSDHIFIPRFVIDDEDFVNEFPSVKKVYASLYSTTDLLEILNLPVSRMKAEIEKLPSESKDVLCRMISTEIAKGRLDSISKVRALSEIFNSDFNLLSELFVK